MARSLDPGHWQHSTPQRDSDHVPKPKFAGTLERHPKCFHCGLPLTRFGNDEGPESLKAMFRF